MSVSRILFVTMLMAGLGFGPGAHAFTYDTHTNQSPDGGARFQDPEDLLENGSSAANHPASGFHFSFSGGNNSNNGLPGNGSGLSNGNGAFASPYSQPSTLDTLLNGRR